MSATEYRAQVLWRVYDLWGGVGWDVRRSLFRFFRFCGPLSAKETALGGVICTPSVPIVAQGLPVVDASICERICAVVVFPFVPVIPMIWRSRSVRIDKYLQHRESA